jgi:hypothetical protein
MRRSVRQRGVPGIRFLTWSVHYALRERQAAQFLVGVVLGMTR